MASDLLKTFQKIERGRQKCIEKANQKNYLLSENASLEQIANCIDSQVNLGEYLSSYKAFLSGDISLLPDEIIKFPSDITGLSNYCFYYNTGIKNVLIPSNIKKIGNYAFSETLLKNVTIEEGLETIGDYAFYMSDGGLQINIPKSVTKIGQSCFYGTTKTCRIEFDGRITSVPSNAFAGGQNTFGSGPIVNFTQEALETITSVSDNGFKSSNCLQNVLTHRIKSIGNYAFQYNDFKEPITIQPTSDLGQHAFDSSNFQKGLTILNGMEALRAYAFNGTRLNQNELIFPESVYNIQSRCFQATLRLTSDENPDEYINKVEFLNKEQFTVSGEGAFVNARFSNIIIHAKKVSINYATVFSSSYIGNIIFLNMTNIPSITSSTFNNNYLTNRNVYVYVPDDIVESLKAATNWTSIKSRIKPLSEWPLYNDYKDQLLPRE